MNVVESLQIYLFGRLATTNCWYFYSTAGTPIISIQMTLKVAYILLLTTYTLRLFCCTIDKEKAKKNSLVVAQNTARALNSFDTCTSLDHE